MSISTTTLPTPAEIESLVASRKAALDSAKEISDRLAAANCSFRNQSVAADDARRALKTIDDYHATLQKVRGRVARFGPVADESLKSFDMLKISGSDYGLRFLLRTIGKHIGPIWDAKREAAKRERFWRRKSAEAQQQQQFISQPSPGDDMTVDKMVQTFIECGELYGRLVGSIQQIVEADPKLAGELSAAVYGVKLALDELDVSIGFCRPQLEAAKILSRPVGSVYKLAGRPGVAVDTIASPSINTSDMSVRAIFATPAIDRQGEVIEPTGIEYDDFLKNPIVLWEHSFDSNITTPIARSSRPELVNGNLEATAFFTDKDEASYQIFTLIAEGIIKATSVHVIPIESRQDHIDGRVVTVYDRSTLLEWSFGRIGVNSEALVKHVATHRLTAPLAASLRPFLPQRNRK